MASSPPLVVPRICGVFDSCDFPPFHYFLPDSSTAALSLPITESAALLQLSDMLNNAKELSNHHLTLRLNESRAAAQADSEESSGSEKDEAAEPKRPKIQ